MTSLPKLPGATSPRAGMPAGDRTPSPRLVSRLRDEDAEPRNAPTYDLALFHGAMGEVAKLDREIARLRALLATHGIDPDVRRARGSAMWPVSSD
jgi:hypothetical protein